MAAPSPTIVEGPTIEKIVFVSRFERRKGFSYEVDSCPGHQINVVRAGCSAEECGGRRYESRVDTGAWYHEAERLRGRVTEAPWVFYSINFIAPSLPPPSFEKRFFRLPNKAVLGCCEDLLKAWQDTAVPRLARFFRAKAHLLQMLAALITPAQQAAHFGQETALWWQLETELRKDLRRSVNLRTMGQFVNRSRATITRSCQLAVGMSPMKRLKQMRLSMARGLVQMSRLTISEIAARVGYVRVHELSRDYHKQFGVTPTEDREQYPKIYQRLFGMPFTTDGEL